MEDLFIQFECVWTVEKHILLNPYITSTVTSPEFEIPSSPLTKWKLGYHTKDAATKSCLHVFLKRTNDDFSEQTELIRFKLFIKGNVATDCSESSVRCTSFIRGHTETLSFTLQNLLIISDLTIKCQFLGRKSELIQSGEVADFKVLSTDINNLLENDVIRDTTLKNRNKTINVHKSILWARCPNLLKLKDGKDLDIDPCAFELLLQYIYTGYLNTHTSEIPLDLIRIAEKYEIIDLQRVISTTPVYICLHSRVWEYTSSHTWIINRFDKQKLKEKVYSPVMNLYSDKLSRWQFAAYSTEQDRETENYSSRNVHISLKCVSIETESPVHLFCKMSIISTVRGEKIPVTSFRHFFHLGEYHIITLDSQSIQSKVNQFGYGVFGDNDIRYDNSLQFKCELSVSDGTISHTASESFFKPEESKTLGYQIFADDLKKLFMEEKISDVTVVVGDRKIPCHKVILAARSPVLSRMFQSEMVENFTNEIIITDVEVSTVLPFLTYIYTAKVELKEVNSVIELYKVADKYEVLDLKGKCRLYLQSNLNFKNFKDILVVADMHSDEELKKFIKTFICNNASEILSQKEWRELIDNRPYLASEILQYLSTKYTLKQDQHSFQFAKTVHSMETNFQLDCKSLGYFERN